MVNLKEIKKRLFETYKDKYLFVFPDLEKTKLRGSYIKLVCNIHGETTQEVRVILKGKGCKKCSKMYLSKELKLKRKLLFTNFLESLNDYKIISKYINANSHVLLHHTVCNKTFRVTPGHFKDGTRCPFCIGRYKTTEDFKKEVYDLVGEEYKVLGKYRTSTSKILIKHLYCGNEYKVSRTKFINNRRCPNCCLNNKSKLSLIVEELLISNKINYKREYRFKDCKHILPLPFDFCIFDNGLIKFLIEVDGRQHREPVARFGGEEAFGKIIKRDKIKNFYCDTRKIKLFRINVENELSKLKEIEEALIYHINEEYITTLDIYFSNTISKELCLEIREYFSKNRVSIFYLTKTFNITRYSVNKILTFSIYPNIGENFQKKIHSKINTGFRLSGEHKYDKFNQQMISMRESGMSYRKIALAFNTGHKIVKKTIDRGKENY